MPKKKSESNLTHLNEHGHAHMVNISDKQTTKRVARASGMVHMQAETLSRILDHTMPKGDVLATARIAGIMGAKKTSELIPLCHPLFLTSVAVDISAQSPTCLKIIATTEVSGQTGVEMEALTAVSVTALTLYDMCKAIDKDMTISDIQLEHKSGGKSGLYQRC